MAGGLAVIFDMDGLMLDTEPLSQRSWRAAAAEAGLDVDAALFARMVGCNMASVHALLFERFGPSCPAEAIGRRARALYRTALDAGGAPHKPGLLDLLDFLEARDVPRAVATSSAIDEARHQLARAGVLHRFHAVVGGDQVARGKPAPDIFLLAAARLAAPPARCAVLEDSGPGVLGARAAGMTAILVPDAADPAPEVREAAHAVVASLAEARPLVARFLDGRAE